MKVAEELLRGKKVINVHALKKEYHGLCLSCQNFSECTYSRDPRIAVLQCEEFEGEVPPTPKSIPYSVSSATGTQVSPLFSDGGHDFNPHRGLCSICEDREVCAFPKPEGGVWHCEEYR